MRSYLRTVSPRTRSSSSGQREKMYVGIFAVTLVWGVWNFRGVFINEEPASTQPGAAAPAAARSAVAVTTPVTVQAAGFSLAHPYVAPRWNADPFHRNWRNATHIARPGQNEQRQATLRLSAVVIRPNIRYAVINGHILKVGQSYEGHTLIPIDSSAVLMDDNGREVKLEL